jgi:hypothetical protein
MSALAAGFLVRIFIIQHDCGHGSFFRSRRANALIASLYSLMTFTPIPSGVGSTPGTTAPGTISTGARQVGWISTRRV